MSGDDKQGEFVATSLSESLEIVVRTDPGVVRGHNEDAVFANPNLGLAILADGMGGYNAGEVASGMATDSLRSELGRWLSGPGVHSTLTIFQWPSSFTCTR